MSNTEQGDKKKNIEEYLYSPHLYLKGWRAIGAYLGVHPQTARKWHYTVLKLPFGKTSQSKQGKVLAAKPIVQLWAEQVGKVRQPKEVTVKVPREKGFEEMIVDRYGYADPGRFAI